ncbi:MAG: hypothetical protein IPM38_04610 [Ignavibacteria bacterium]|nr:hypothetical protein [Ignavibacteria bacterium]
MNQYKVNLIISILFLFAGNTVNAQSDSVNTYYPDEISIEYISGSMQTIVENKTVRVPILIDLDGIKKIRFLNDSLISLSLGQKSEQQLNINKINGISIKSEKNIGPSMLSGALVGLLAGTITGVAIGSANEESSSGYLSGFETVGGGMIGAGSGILIGLIVGGLVGSSSYDYKMYKLNNKADKKKQIERILKIDKKRKLSEQ